MLIRSKFQPSTNRKHLIYWYIKKKHILKWWGTLAGSYLFFWWYRRCWTSGRFGSSNVNYLFHQKGKDTNTGWIYITNKNLEVSDLARAAYLQFNDIILVSFRNSQLIKLEVQRRYLLMYFFSSVGQSRDGNLNNNEDSLWSWAPSFRISTNWISISNQINTLSRNKQNTLQPQ